jgi:hypothetical protein
VIVVAAAAALLVVVAVVVAPAVLPPNLLPVIRIDALIRIAPTKIAMGVMKHASLSIVITLSFCYCHIIFIKKNLPV